ncbi:hypothetical protein AGOR_G00110220 [Albula goreensis]|uniref:Vacuolar protein 8 n=1 Tax=Albula goreensis TaxID=1534307 RepID=A0A8T3DH95_9TELE|nr:hypothetical protein AGOR_G00110220 [Albula goreensis]
MGLGVCERCARLLEELVAYVRKLSRELVERIKECVRAISECCCLRKKTTVPRTLYHPVVKEHERRAALELLQHLDADSVQEQQPHASETLHCSGSELTGIECLHALNTLAVSENHELQQSAAAYLLHLSQQLPTALPSEFLEPYPALLQSCDLEVQRTASLSLVNFLVEHNVNKDLVVEMGILDPILDLLESEDPTVQCNSCACVAMLATSDVNREAITSADGVLQILVLAKSYDPRVQQNAVGALLNLTRSERMLEALCREGALPVLALLLQSADSEVQFYSCCALRNVAAVPEYHPRMLGIGDCFLLKSLLSLLSSPVEKNSCQACLCLRNFCVNVRTQEELVALGGVSPLISLLSSPAVRKAESAISLLSALSQHPPNRGTLVEEGLVQAVGKLLLLHGNSSSAIVSHGAMTLRNLSATPTSQQAVMNSECVSRLLEALAAPSTTEQARVCVASCLHQLSSLDLLKPLFAKEVTADHVSHLVSFADQTDNPELSFHAASTIGQLGMKDAPLLSHHSDAVLGYLLRFLKSQEVRFQQLAISTLSTLKNVGCFADAISGKLVQEQLLRVRMQTERTSDLLRTVPSPLPRLDEAPSAKGSEGSDP